MHILSAIPLAGTALITDPTWIFFTVLCIILLAPLLLRRLNIPHVIGLILAGILVGKYGLNVLERDSSFELFGQVGIYYIMFLAGLELDMGSVEKYGRQGFQFGVFTFFIPFVLGFAASYYVLGYGVLTCLLLSCIFASNTLVTYPIVGRYGMGRHHTVVVSVVATALATFASLLCLALVVSSMEKGTSWHTWLFFALKCAAYGLFVLLVYPRLGRWFLRRFDDSVLQYIFIMALVFLSAALAKMVGLEGLLGAFLAGLVVNRLIPKTSPLMTRLEFVGNALFIPYFLIGVGMIIDVKILLSDLSTIRLVVVMVLTATLTKWLASALMAWLSGGNRSSMWLMFGLTNAHAAGALAIVMIGTNPELQLMDNQVLNGTVMLILFSCIISGFATNHGARNLALSDTTLEENRGSYHGKCLITYSQAEEVDVMTQLAILIRNPYIPDSLMGLSVAYDVDNNDGVDRYRRGKLLLEKAQRIAASADVPMATLNRMSTNIAGGILHTMKEYECGEVIMCLTDRTTGMPKSSLGSIIDSVVSGSHREVMAVRSIVPPGTMRSVVVAVPQKAEYEVGFYKWLEHICRIGEQLDCHLHFNAHADTLPYIRGYMGQKHGNLRAEYHEMNRWTQLLSLPSRLSANSMLVIVTARPGFISYQSSFDNLPLQIHRYFGHTSVMLLFPDQWGDPLESVSVFAPNGTAVTRSTRNLRSLFRRFFTCMAFLLAALGAQADGLNLHKMSPMVRQITLQQSASKSKSASAPPSNFPLAPRREGQGVRLDQHLTALVRVSDPQALAENGCSSLAHWGDIHVADIPLSRLSALARCPQVERIEASPSGMACLDSARQITRCMNLPADVLHPDIPLQGDGVVLGVMDIGFDLTHPTFYSEDMRDYRIRSFWDQLDTLHTYALNDSTRLGAVYEGRDELLQKARAFDGQRQFHGTHVASTAAGSGYGSPYVGIAPHADLCLVANCVTSDLDLIPEEYQYLYTRAADLLGFKYIMDYADRVGKPCAINFSEGSYQDLYGDDLLAYEVLDSLTGPGHIICSAAGNQSTYLTYLHKPAGMKQNASLLQFTGDMTYFTLRSTDKTTIGLTFYSTPTSIADSISISTDEVLACPDSMKIDTLQVGGKQYMVLLAAYPSCYNAQEWATELLIQDLGPADVARHWISLTLMGEEQNVEAFASGGHFEYHGHYKWLYNAQMTHNIQFPGCAPSVICVGSSAYRTGVYNRDGEWAALDYGSGGERAQFSSVGPTMMGLTKPDVMAPGTNIIAAMSSFYMEEKPASWNNQYDVARFDFEGRTYAWNAQTGTSMACPVVTGIVALWLQACPTLSPADVMDVLAHSCRQNEWESAYPNNRYGYGEIDAEAGLRYIRSHCLGIDDTSSKPTRQPAAFDLTGRPVSLDSAHGGVFILRDANGNVRKTFIR